MAAVNTAPITIASAMSVSNEPLEKTATLVVKSSRQSPLDDIPKILPEMKPTAKGVEIPLLEPKLVEAPTSTHDPWTKRMHSAQKLVLKTELKVTEPSQKVHVQPLLEDVPEEKDAPIGHSTTVLKSKNEWTEVQHKTNMNAHPTAETRKESSKASSRGPAVAKILSKR
jgi:hypothetical protein